MLGYQNTAAVPGGYILCFTVDGEWIHVVGLREFGNLTGIRQGVVG